MPVIKAQVRRKTAFLTSALSGIGKAAAAVREFGVHVVVIEPAVTRTSFETSTAPSDTPLAVYNSSRAKYLVAYERAIAVADSAESVAETIVKAARDKTARLRYLSGKAARQVAFARRFAPQALLDKILRSQFGLA
jgi:short-subunit dehydrogenase